MMYKSIAILAIALAAGQASATPSPFNLCVFPFSFLCPPTNDTSFNDTSANVTVGLNISATDNFSAPAVTDSGVELFTNDGVEPFTNDDSDVGEVTVIEVVTVTGGDDGGAVETVFVEEIEYITIPEETQTVTVAMETVTVGADGADASLGTQ